MYIQCTQKLLAKLKMPYGELPNPPETVYCWHASFFEQYELRYVVMMNDETGEEIFFPIDSFQDFDKLVLDEMKLDMEDGGASAKKVKAYMKGAGPLTFGPTSDRSLVAQLSGYTRRMKNLIDKMYNLRDILEREGSSDNLVVHFNAEIEALAASQEKKKPKPKAKPRIIAASELMITPMVALDVALQLEGDKKVERSFLVPLHINFYTLHAILQVGFGWYDSHLYEFSNEDRTLVIGMDPSDMSIEQESILLDVQKAILSDYIPGLKRFGYLYDFDDSWDHLITVGAITTVEGDPFVLCTGGQGSTPPEDCGGAPGYERMCEILTDPSDDEYEDMLEWASDDFDKCFDQDRINGRLKVLKFIPYTGE